MNSTRYRDNFSGKSQTWIAADTCSAYFYFHARYDRDVTTLMLKNGLAVPDTLSLNGLYDIYP